MIDSADNCLTHAATARIAAEGPMLENVRRKHLASAKAWEELAAILKSRPRANLPTITTR
ncbi:MAG: hypothetical protein P0Y56_00890 [Candidatus Andeanibacterium colombiense]|uniref:Uncharacterized protein n=1 Tax=Candidatus Andeanibacterium colombiense TaxID=3121345 RepID=A0AAJ5X5I9_9SPHN|nr:MAG: hypothetical protein P0Y56_00890 [Sphingomonadaceae bacterium]